MEWDYFTFMELFIYILAAALKKTEPLFFYVFIGRTTWC